MSLADADPRDAEKRVFRVVLFINLAQALLGLGVGFFARSTAVVSIAKEACARAPRRANLPPGAGAREVCRTLSAFGSSDSTRATRHCGGPDALGTDAVHARIGRKGPRVGNVINFPIDRIVRS